MFATLGTVAVASLFLLGGVNKLFNWQTTFERMETAGLTPAAFLLPMTIALELAGGLALIYGRWPAVTAGALLAVFTLATNLFFHRFWEFDGRIAELELSLFFKNVAIAGALVVIAARHWET